MQTKRIFLASSAELERDRRAFEVTIGRLNRVWKDRGLFFEVVVWENFIDAMSKDGLQHEYDKAVADSDLFVMLFFTKVGRYTNEEFQTAFGAFRDGGKPRIYTYFRNDFVRSGDIDESIRSLLDFKQRLLDLKHYVTHYTSVEHLQYLFTEQLDKLYAADAGLAVDDATPQAKVDENALVLASRQLDDTLGRGAAGIAMLQTAVQRSTSRVRNAVFSMANQVRRESWASDKRLMERTIPILEALARSEPSWHAPHGALGYALKDRMPPDWVAAKASLDRAVELRGSDAAEGRYYHYARAVCAVHLDPRAEAGEPADAPTRAAVLQTVKAAARDCGADWERMLADPESAALRRWLQLNGSPRLR